jgi:hypothetical protein
MELLVAEESDEEPDNGATSGSEDEYSRRIVTYKSGSNFPKRKLTLIITYR